ncbi:MAG: hypothetical protein Q7R47_04370, partial [Candidatus Diapherotrites archaeon]|nr:hypothetical protein [Candidatus Diapherotrites archaeon]
KTVVRRVKSKPKIKYRTRTKTVVKRVPEKPVVQYKTRVEKVEVKDPSLQLEINRLNAQLEKQRLANEVEVQSMLHRNELRLLEAQKDGQTERLSLQKRYGEQIAQLNAEMTALSVVSGEQGVQSVRIVRHPGAEQVPQYVLATFFGEISHVGFKRNLSLDDVIAAYFYAVAKVSQRMGKQVLDTISNEEAAHHILHLYFKEVATHRTKRRMDIDEVLDAYFYVLDKLQNKGVLVKRAESQVLEQKTVTTTVKTDPPLTKTTIVETKTR